MKKRGSKSKNKSQKKNYLVLVTVFSLALAILFSHSIFQNSSVITGLVVGDSPETNSLFQQLVDKALEEQELNTKMAQNSAERQKILLQIIAQQQKPNEPVAASDTSTIPSTTPSAPPATTPVVTPAFIPDGCTDSDGRDYFKQGTVEVVKNNEKGSDYCSPGKKLYPNLLLEKVCLLSGDYLSTSIDQIYCDAPCDNGACPISTKTAKCTETDNGKDLFVKGTTKYEGGQLLLTDSCVTASAVRENYCEDGVIKQKIILCDGASCSDGACVKK